MKQIARGLFISWIWGKKNKKHPTQLLHYSLLFNVSPLLQQFGFLGLIIISISWKQLVPSAVCSCVFVGDWRLD
jgi:hypothetical protein